MMTMMMMKISSLISSYDSDVTRWDVITDDCDILTVDTVMDAPVSVYTFAETAFRSIALNVVHPDLAFTDTVD